MTWFQIVTVLTALAAVFSYVNFRYVGLPTTIGVMLMSTVGSVALIVAGHWVPAFHDVAKGLVERVDFEQTLLHGMLAFLLFAGSLHVNFHDLRREWGLITAMVVGGLLLSTVLVAVGAYYAFGALGLHVPPIYCLLFGALISPTDPIAVLAIMKGAGASKSLETQIGGESLFNDGVGVVVFLTALEVALSGAPPTWTGTGGLLAREVVGGLLVGLIVGFVVYQMLKRVDNYQVEVLLTLALAMGVYALAEAVHASAPIAVVIAGLFTGNPGREHAMSKQTERYVDGFWELIDEILNALLFLLIGLELLVMPRSVTTFALPAVAAVGIALVARWASVGAAVGLSRLWRTHRRGTVAILTWGGLRGGLSIAMALSLPRNEHRDFLVAMTYAVVAFSVFAQGTTVGPLIPPVPAEPAAWGSDGGVR